LRNQDWVAPSLNTTADGALYLTVLDMAHWDAGQYGTKLLKRESFNQMWTPVKLNSKGSFPYGFGWRLGYQRGHRIIEHGGHWQGFSTAISRYPDYSLSVIVLTNLSDINATSIAEEVAGIYEPALQSVKQLKAVPESEPELTAELKEMLSTIANKEEPKTLMPIFRQLMEKDTVEEIAKIVPNIKSFEPLGCDFVQGEPMELYGDMAVRYCNYRVETPTETRVLIAGVTRDLRFTEFSLIE
jgi:hypothetical protein